jgi:hypothetical protein
MFFVNFKSRALTVSDRVVRRGPEDSTCFGHIGECVRDDWWLNGGETVCREFLAGVI